MQAAASSNHQDQARGDPAAELDGVGIRYAWAACADIGGEELRRPESLVSSRSGFPVTAPAGARYSAVMCQARRKKKLLNWAQRAPAQTGTVMLRP